ncbi:MAG: AbrB/MazE/SpoVT family DNA-binding domain-containing protein [Chloroflexi bacterium]|nr:AbrB/MazE/SpoVT family DNA-binding domain-containing protein [Chloroflexota bacterium]
MTTVTVSPKYQIVIPKEIREQMGIKPGQKLIAIYYDNKLEFVPEVSIADARGMFKGMGISSEVPREDDRY